jgi:phage virion morphogenesis protein
MTITVETRGFETAIFKINRFAEFSRNDLLSALAETVRKQTLRRFVVTKTAPSGARWAPLKNPGKNRGSGDILVDSGRLMGSISSKVSGSTAEVGTNVFYGKFHQYGTRKMVARPFLGMNATDVAELRIVAERFIMMATGAF